MPQDGADLPYDCQLALFIFNALPDNIEGMSGLWLGKDFSGLSFIFDLYVYRDSQFIFELILVCIDEIGKHYEEQRKRTEKSGVKR